MRRDEDISDVEGVVGGKVDSQRSTTEMIP